MAKVNNKTKGFGSIPRDVVYDNELSDRARFVYVYMACKPENWEFYQDKVADELGYGKDTLRKYLDELIIRGWITENEQQNDGKFGCLEYIIEVKRKVGNLPIRKKSDSEKTSNGKIPNQRNIDNISSKQSLSDNKEIENNKRLSNDNPKEDYPDDFLEFYNAYGYAKSKSKAYQSWKKLSKKDKKAAIDAIPAYKEDCKANDREMKYPSTYLNQRTWEDDFDISKKSVLCYEPLPDDEDKVLRFKRWMRENHAEIEFTEKPLTFDGYMRLQNEYGMDEVCNQLDYIDANIGRFRKSDIEASIKYYFEHQQYD